MHAEKCTSPILSQIFLNTNTKADTKREHIFAKKQKPAKVYSI